MSCTPNVDILARTAVIKEPGVQGYLHPLAFSEAEVMCKPSPAYIPSALPSVNGNRSIDICITLETLSLEVMAKFLIMWFSGIKAEDLSYLSYKKSYRRQRTESIIRESAGIAPCLCVNMSEPGTIHTG